MDLTRLKRTLNQTCTKIVPNPLSKKGITNTIGRKSLLVAFLLFVAFHSGAQTPAATIPDFEFSKPDGTAFTRSSLAAGKSRFFVFFDTSCDHCQHAIGFLEKHLTELAPAAVYLVTLDQKPAAASFLAKYGPGLVKAKNVQLLFDSKNHFITKFTPRKYPSLMLYSKDAKLLQYEDDEKKLPEFLVKIKSGK